MDKTQINYWNSFYKKNNEFTIIPSDFCLFVMNFFNNFNNINYILDAGCGNGRDSYYLSNKYNVLGVDISGYKNINKNNCHFKIENFITIDKKEFDIIYSRFTFHSINNEQQLLFLQSIKPNTYLCLETRSDKCLNNFDYHYGNEHYRNLTNFNYLNELLLNNNFVIDYIEENINFANYKDENPYCIRVICKKK
jgi:SAM-dependent methyltransferase